jgi:serine/threonine protein kinase
MHPNQGGGPQTTSGALRTGARLGRFRLVSRIALGGMAEVWSASDEDASGEIVALKVMRPSWAEDAEFHGMFHDEVAISSHLRHENIVQVHGGEEIDGLLVQIMELLDGEDLRRILKRLHKKGWRFPIPLALYVGRSIAKALGYAHLKRDSSGQPLKIVHRDISPHNVLLAADGRVKLLDFGIAKAAERRTRTRMGVVKGKTAYMAPEQTIASKLDHRVDIFAAGTVLWEMLAQQRLFLGTSDPDTMERVRSEPHPRLETIRSDIPTELADLVDHMLEKNPRARPASMYEVERRLQRLIVRAYEPHEAGPRALESWLSKVRAGASEGTRPLPASSARRADPADDRTEIDSAPSPE